MALNDDILGGEYSSSSILDSIKQINDAWADSITSRYGLMDRLMKHHFDIEKKTEKEMLELQLKNGKLSYEDKKKAIEKLKTLQQEAYQEAANIAKKVDAEIYRNASFLEKKRIKERDAQEKKEYADRLAQEQAIAKIRGEKDEEQRKLAKELEEKRKQALKDLEKERAELERLKKVEYDRMHIWEKADASRQKRIDAEQKYRQSLLNFDEKSGTQQEVDSARQELKVARLEEFGTTLLANMEKGLENTLKNAWGAIANGLKQIDSTLDTLYANQGKINARLQGTSLTYQRMLSDVGGTIGISPFVSQRTMIENITKLVDSGVAYNIEQRAFLATISENIADTFDVFDSNLMRLIRLQQADSTAARLGMEAMLTRFLGQRFSDTTYLKEAYDSVSAALVDASAQLSKEESVAFDFIAQKWLGSLSSLGLSTSTASSIAGGLGLLGSGGATQLSSNPQMQTLLAMSASRAGISYGDVLTGGLTAETTNSLLKSMVEYLREIARGDNLVVKSQYSQMLGLSMSDLVSLQSLTDKEIADIYKTTLSYSGAEKELSSQIGKVRGRMSVGQMMENLFGNIVTGIASGIGSNVGTYALWKITDLVEQATGGINIPAVMAVGSGVDLNATVEQLMKIGVAGMGVLSQIGPMISAFSSGGTGLNSLNSWNASPYLSRGQGFVGITNTGFTRGTSEIGYVGSASSSDMYKDTLMEQKERADETQKILNQEEQKKKDIQELFESVISSSGTDSIRVHIVGIDSNVVFRTDTLFD